MMHRMKKWPSWLPPRARAIQRWLGEQASLSRRLDAAVEGFHVQVLSERRAVPRPDEKVFFAPRAWVRERDVLLCDRHEALVYARTLSVANARDAAWLLLRRLGSRPLGHLLFEDPKVYRSPLGFRRLDARHALHRRIEKALHRQLPALWARRSLFVLRGRALLVTEVFLPPMETLR